VRGHSKLLDMMPLVSMSDEELREQVSKAKAGDDEAVAIVLSAVMRRVYWLAQRYERVDLLDDMIQEGAMAVLCAIEKFDEDRAANSSFIFYASLWVKSRIRSYLKKEVQIRTHDKVEYKSMDAPLVDDERRLHDVLPSDAPTPSVQYQLSHDKTVLLELMERLNDNEKEAIMYAFGIGVKQSLREDYARRCGVSSVTVCNRIRSGVMKLRKMAEEGMTK
jgi:RNA polymerase sigma factor (sigma-70 family)